jgi:hypothetical protein
MATNVGLNKLAASLKATRPTCWAKTTSGETHGRKDEESSDEANSAMCGLRLQNGIFCGVFLL